MEGKRQLEKRDFGKRLSLDSSLVEYMDSNKYIEHLLTQLEEQHRSLWREKLAVARLQREVAQRTSERAVHEKLIRELEEERHLRLQSEKRLREVTLESERNRAQMRGLQGQFSRMEETVRNLLQSQGPPEQNKEETVSVLVYQEKLSEEERKHKEALDDLPTVVDEDSRSESSSTDEGKEKNKLLLERLKALEAENSALALENENQREQYERCLDEVANQVVQALLTQKDLREECVKLKTRVFDLEQQNRTLSILFQQRVRPTSDLLLQVKEANENIQEDEEDTIADSAFQSHVVESNCQMRTLDSGIGTFPLPDSGNRVTARYLCQPDSSEDTEPLLPLQQAPSTACSIRAQTLEREVPSFTDSQLATEMAIVHSTSDPIMMARGTRPPQSHLPKAASSEIETS
uniref:NCK associated protein 5 n=1 Tax=Cavia porcellus TaxID=10141 RepID=H0VJJ2_CAVPO